MTSSVVVLSGGMDSATALWWARRDSDPSDKLIAMSVDYGQRHRKELDAAKQLAEIIGADWQLVHLGIVLPGSALTDETVAVPHGHYADDSMKATVVPNRNMMILAAATALAVAHGCDQVVTGVHAGDHPVYPDCRPEFIDAMNEAVRVGNEGMGFVQILAPFLHSTKTDIASIGSTLGVPFELTWSCYEGGDVHCGRCGTCVERREAFSDAGIVDPTVYT